MRASRQSREITPGLQLVEDLRDVPRPHNAKSDALLFAIMETAHKLKTALDAPDDIRYIEELNDTLSSLVRSWKNQRGGQ